MNDSGRVAPRHAVKVLMWPSSIHKRLPGPDLVHSGEVKLVLGMNGSANGMAGGAFSNVNHFMQSYRLDSLLYNKLSRGGVDGADLRTYTHTHRKIHVQILLPLS